MNFYFHSDFAAFLKDFATFLAAVSFIFRLVIHWYKSDPKKITTHFIICCIESYGIEIIDNFLDYREGVVILFLQ